MTSMIRFVFVAVVTLLLVVLAFTMIGCLPLQGVGAAIGDAVGNTVHSPYRALMEESFPDTLVVPVAGVSRRKLHDSWGAARDGGERSHEGIDIFAKRKTPVVSATHGIIT